MEDKELKAILQSIHEAMVSAAYQAAHGLLQDAHIEMNGGKFGMGEATLKVKLRWKDGLADDLNRRTWDYLCPKFGLPESEVVGVWVEYGDALYALQSINQRRPKYPVDAIRRKLGERDKTMKLNAAMARGIARLAQKQLKSGSACPPDKAK